MARLRRESCESHKSTEREGEPCTLKAAKQRRGLATRSSPRKETAVSYRHDVNLPFQSSDEAVRHTPKDTLRRKQAGKQIRLVPLKTLQSSTAAFAARLPAKSFGRETGIQRSALSPKKKAQASWQEVPQPWEPEALPVIDDSAEATEVEESIWCESDAASNDSDEELPSPGTFVKRPPKLRSPRKVPKGTAGSSDLSAMLRDLTISDFSSTAAAPPLVKQKSTADLSSRPTSSSDKENNDKAILRFSPPRLHSPRKQQSTPERPITPPQTSPSKGRLQSPSKSRARLPTPPHRPSLDAFWNAETVNDWNDQYSPRKEWMSPKKLQLLRDDASQSPTTSPRKPPPPSPTKRTKAELEAKRAWEARKHQVAVDFLAQVDQTVTGGQIQDLAASTGGVRFIWSKTLNSTAGRANWKRETTKTRQLDDSTTLTHRHHASIELAEKVIDDEDRLRNVLAHEFCHLCNFMISGVKDQPHGRQFKEWGRKVTQAFNHVGVEVTTKHAYQIEYKYIWQCSNEECAVEFKRHSKSIDVKRHTCGSCRSKLVQIRPAPRKGGVGAGAQANGYAAYVKLHFAETKRGMPTASQKEVMEAVGRKYRAEKEELARKQGSETAVDADEVVEIEPSPPKTAEVDKVARVLEFITLDDNEW